MKTIYKLITLVVVAGGFLFSCETTELELLVSPNTLTIDNADPDLLLNDIQTDYNTSMTVFNDRSSELSRIDYVGGRNYNTMYNSSALDGNWNRTYSVLLANLRLIETINGEGSDFNYHIAVGKTLVAHSLMLLVDFVANVPYSEAGNPLEFPSPNLDSGADVYASALMLLNEAGALFASNQAPPGVLDLYYGGSSGQWIKLVNTLKMRHALTIGDLNAFNAIVSGGNFIASSADDFEFKYGTQQLTPNTQHQDYFADYQTSGANIYQSNWLMETMQGVDKSDGADDDPRIRYYYFRQSQCTPGATCEPAGNGETLSCSLETPPPHYQAGGVSYCWLEDGYWGRDHGDDDGTPPDGFIRTAVGVYPAAGLFDDNRFGGLNINVGGLGEGIEPIVLASYVDFWRAEAAMASGNPGAAATHVQNGMQKSIAKAQTFIDKDGSADSSFEPSSTYVSDYIAARTALITDTSDDSWNVLAEEYFIAMYGGGADAYSFYRRTGYPTTVKPNLEPDPGVFPRTFFYPSVEVIANPNVLQRPNLTDQVFWDTNPAGPTFPPAN